MTQWNLTGPDVTCVRLPTGAAESTRKAARELAAYLKKMTGRRLPVEEATGSAPAGHVLAVGLSPDETLGTDGFCVRATQDAFCFDGGVRGILYGVYDTLEQLGCLFLTPECEKIPQGSEALLAADYYRRETPVFEYRSLFWKTATPKNAAKWRLNSLLEETIAPEDGGCLSYCGFVHTLGHLAGMSGTDYTDRQPCLTDEMTYETVLKNLRSDLAGRPGAAIASVSQNDSHAEGRGCACEACRALDEAEGTPMGSLLTFVNRVAAKMEKEQPGLAIDTLAYRYTRKPPKTLHARANVIIRLCSIECCFSHPIDSCNQTMYPVEGDSFADTLRAWAEHSDRIYIWDYTTNFRNYHAPFPNFGVLRRNVRFFAENHVKGVFEQGNNQSLNGEFGPLRAWLLAKLLWNPYMTEEEYQGYIDRFLRGYYGAGAPALRRYLDRLTRAAENVHFGIYAEDPAALFVDPDIRGDALKAQKVFLEKGRADFAEAAAAADETEKQRIAQAAVQLDVYEWYWLSHCLAEAGEAEKPLWHDRLLAAGRTLYGHARAHGFLCMHESGDYRHSMDGEEPDYLQPPHLWGK